VANGRKRLDWPQTAINLAFAIAKSRSEDPYVQVGAVIIKNDDSMLVGYNGAPPNIDIDWSDRDIRREYVLHAEANVLNYAKPNEVKLLACTHLPCKECMKLISLKNIKSVFYSKILDNYDPQKSFGLAETFNIHLIQKNEENIS